MLNATRNGRAPIAVAPAVEWIRLGPTSGSAAGGATDVKTERLWAASAWTSSSLTPGTPVSAVRRASMVAALRPSEKFGTHSTRGDGIETSNAERGARNAEQQGGLWLLRSYVRSAFPLPRSAFS